MERNRGRLRTQESGRNESAHTEEDSFSSRDFYSAEEESDTSLRSCEYYEARSSPPPDHSDAMEKQEEDSLHIIDEEHNESNTSTLVSLGEQLDDEVFQEEESQPGPENIQQDDQAASRESPNREEAAVSSAAEENKTPIKVKYTGTIKKQNIQSKSSVPKKPVPRRHVPPASISPIDRRQSTVTEISPVTLESIQSHRSTGFSPLAGIAVSDPQQLLQAHSRITARGSANERATVSPLFEETENPTDNVLVMDMSLDEIQEEKGEFQEEVAAAEIQEESNMSLEEISESPARIAEEQEEIVQPANISDSSHKKASPKDMGQMILETFLWPGKFIDSSRRSSSIPESPEASAHQLPRRDSRKTPPRSPRSPQKPDIINMNKRFGGQSPERMTKLGPSPPRRVRMPKTPESIVPFSEVLMKIDENPTGQEEASESDTVMVKSPRSKSQEIPVHDRLQALRGTLQRSSTVESENSSGMFLKSDDVSMSSQRSSQFSLEGPSVESGFGSFFSRQASTSTTEMTEHQEETGGELAPLDSGPSTSSPMHQPLHGEQGDKRIFSWRRRSKNPRWKFRKGFSDKASRRRKVRELKQGTEGMKIKLKTNCLELHLDNLIPLVYKYNLNINPKLPRETSFTEMFRQFREALQEQPRELIVSDERKAYNVFDLNVSRIGKEAYVIIPRHPPRLEERYEINSYGVVMKNSPHLKLSLRALKQNHLSNKNRIKFNDGIQCINGVLREVLTYGFWKWRMGQLDVPLEPLPLTEQSYANGISRFYQNVICGEKIFLNVDLSFGSVRVTELLQLIGINLYDEFDQEKKRTIHDLLEGHTLTTIYGAELSEIVHPSLFHIFKLHSVQDAVNLQPYFYVNNYSTVSNHFLYLHPERKYELQYCQMPAIYVTDPDADYICMVPLEICKIITDIHTEDRVASIQEENLRILQVADKKNRLILLEEMVKRLNYNDSEYISEFYGISVDKNLAKVDARVLPTRSIMYKSNHIVMPSPDDGMWSMNDAKFLRSMRSSNYTDFSVLMVNIFQNVSAENDLQRVVDAIMNSSHSKGLLLRNIYVEWITYNECKEGNPRIVFNILNHLKKFSRFVLVFLRDKKTVNGKFAPDPNLKIMYRDIKLASERSVGIVTQCVNFFSCITKENKAWNGFINSIVCQINAKLNGINHEVQTEMIKSSNIIPEHTMIVGGCIIDGGRDESMKPVRITGIASSYKTKYFKYKAKWCYQKYGGVAYIENLSNVIYDHLFTLEENYIKRPTTIIYYRLITNENNFEKIESAERLQILSACRRISARYKPRIIIIGTVRHHKVKFFPSPPQELELDDATASFPQYNVPSGTVVDSEVVHPLRREFFLVSHKAGQGIARPTKYIVAANRNTTMETLQNITYNLTHMYSLTCHTISCVPPIYYALRIAEKGKLYLPGLRLPDKHLERYSNQRKAHRDLAINNTMYFV